MADPTTFLESERLTLRPLKPDDASNSYLGWLNDPDVLRYRAPKAFPSSMDDLKRWLSSIGDRGDLHLAICEKATGRHVGNVSLNSIQWVHRSAELSIMIGAKDVWGKGYAKEAMERLVRHGFEGMGLHRIWAESPNPAFNKAVAALGWTREGTKREAFLLDGRYVDFECWSILAAEYKAGRGKAEKRA